MPTHAMIDLETLDITPQAAVLTVGGVKFNPLDASEPHSEFYYKLDLDTQDRSVNDDTIAWWGKQEQSTQDRAFSDVGRTDIEPFMKDLNSWLVGCDTIWCQGPQFDMVILEDLFKTFDHHMNWFYWQVNDCRTLFKMMPKDPRKDIQEDLHDALADAHWQAVCVQQFFDMYKVLPR